MAKSARIGHVYLVGAGPGDPRLLTLRAVECLNRAELVIYDRLVDRRALAFSPTAEQLCVTDLPGTHPERGPQVQERLINEARSGKTVVRLKGGDPYLFGRGGEEAAALQEAGIPFEVVPGVTAALAGGACVGVPLTHRDFSSAVAFVTGHECSGKGPAALDWEALARFPGTLAVYMGLARLDVIAATLVQHGKPAATPVIAIQQASTNRQKVVEGTLADIAALVAKAQLQGPVVTLIGAVVQLRSGLDWFAARPLFGCRVLVTRPEHQAESLLRQLEELGAAVDAMPAVAIGPPPDEAAIRDVLNRLSDFQWLVFTSANGVEAFLTRLEASGRDWRALAGVRLAAIGPKTAAALSAQRLRADVVPRDFCSESLSQSLLPLVKGQRVLLARADRGRELLPEQLSRVAEVVQIAVYSQVDCLTADARILADLRDGQIDFVTLTSSNIARSFVRLLDAGCRERLGRDTRVVTISPVTSAAVRELGIPVAAEAAEATMESLVSAVVALAEKKT